MPMNKSYYLIDLKQLEDSRGKMCVVECTKDIPFVIKRVFYDFNHKTDSVSRGNHANKHSSFVFICVAGSCSITVDDGQTIDTFCLDSPTKGLFINKMVWKSMTSFSKDCILLVLSDHHYDSNEYINNYNDYLIQQRSKL